MNDLNSPSVSPEKMPVLFLGHGSPMNAVEENEFVLGWREIGMEIPRPVTIVCVSAHWETGGVFVSAVEKPSTIHDFGGFPGELYEVQYPAHGNPALAAEIKDILGKSVVSLDFIRGLDHGCWSVLKQIYPEADIPVIQISLDYTRSARQHYNLATGLKVLRKKGVLLVASGNMVHNLRLVAWDKLNNTYGYEWANQASSKMKELIFKGDIDKLINYEEQGREFSLAIPTPEHYLPLLYSLAVKENDDKISIFNDKPVGGSLTMTCLKIG